MNDCVTRKAYPPELDSKSYLYWRKKSAKSLDLRAEVLVQRRDLF
jgi:hypothetical protein